MAGRIGIVSRLIVAAFLLCFGLSSTAHAEKRVALVIGNSAYQAVPPLPNPTADARLMSDTLRSLGFFVVGGGARLDLDRTGFDEALKAFGTELIGADVALFYFAGHGVRTSRPELSGAGRRPSAGRGGCLHAAGQHFRHPRSTREIRHADQSRAARRLSRQSVSGSRCAIDHRRPRANARPGRHADFLCHPAAQRLARRRRRSQSLHKRTGGGDAEARRQPVQDLQRSRPRGGEGNRRPAIAVAVVLAHQRQFLLRRQVRAHGVGQPRSPGKI